MTASRQSFSFKGIVSRNWIERRFKGIVSRNWIERRFLIFPQKVPGDHRFPWQVIVIPQIFYFSVLKK